MLEQRLISGVRNFDLRQTVIRDKQPEGHKHESTIPRLHARWAKGRQLATLPRKVVSVSTSLVFSPMCFPGYSFFGRRTMARPG